MAFPLPRLPWRRRDRDASDAPAVRAAGATAPGGAHAEPVEDVLARLGCARREGLTEGEARRRLAAHGPNSIGELEARSRLDILRGQLDLPTAVLGTSAALSAVLGDLLDAGAIALVIGVNAAIGYRLERRSEALLAAWQRLEAGTARVIRDGASRDVAAADLVPGDLVLFRAGDLVPADARVVETHRVTVDESTLTGESEPVTKAPAPVDPAAPVADQRSMVWKGTTVASGHGRAVVVATGEDTQVAAIRAMVEAARHPRAPLQRRLGQLGRRVMWAGMGAAAITAAAGLAWRRPPLELLRSAVALGVASIPEGLPVTATAALVRSMSRMRATGMIVRKLSVAETLGGVTVVCADKTGTLTENAMRLVRVELDGERRAAADLRADPSAPLGSPVSRLLAVAVLNSDLDYHRTRDGELQIAGSATEEAIARAAQDAGLDAKTLRRAYPRRLLAERRAGVHYVVSLHDTPDGDTLACMKGAPEQVLPLCARDDDGPLDDAARADRVRRNAELASDGHRVLAVAWQRLPRGAAHPPDEGWCYAGLLALRDPVRAHAGAAVRAAAAAGVRTVILTGDQCATAAAVAREVGLAGDVVEGGPLVAALRAGDPDAAARLDRVSVIARVTPADKVAVVEALRARGHVVAMAGDGVNDAAALKVADVGIAVGVGASDLARQTADVVLEHEDLRSILTAIGEGRIVHDNLRRAARYLLATNLGEVLIVVAGAVLGRAPLSSLQLLWINLLSDTLPALALALEPGDPAILDRPPAPPDQPLLGSDDWRAITRDGVALAAIAGAAGVAGGPGATVAAVMGSQLGYATIQRAPEHAADPNVADAQGRFVGLVGGTAVLQLAAMAVPAIRTGLRLGGGPGAVAAFAGAFAIPLVARLWSRADEIVVRGRASSPSPPPTQEEPP